MSHTRKGLAGAVLVELSVVEQRYHAVMEVISGAPVTEVADRYGVSVPRNGTGEISRFKVQGRTRSP
jgi:hypothetical protein